MRRLAFWRGVLIGAALLSAGCGYTTRSMIANSYRTIYIAPFASTIDITQESDVGNKYKVYRPGLETDVSKSIINKFLFDGNVKPVNMENADLELKGELIEFRRDPLRYTTSDEVEEYRLSIIVNISLWDRAKDKMLWEERGFTADSSYFTRGASAKTEEVAIKDAIADLGRRVVARVVEEW